MWAKGGLARFRSRASALPLAIWGTKVLSTQPSPAVSAARGAERLAELVMTLVMTIVMTIGAVACPSGERVSERSEFGACPGLETERHHGELAEP